MIKLTQKHNKAVSCLAPPSLQLTPPSVCVNGIWTEFFNGDDPRGEGDLETLRELNNQFGGRVCWKPSAVDARIASNGQDYRSAGQAVQINTEVGFVCLNRNQPNRESCLDYQVRFCCWRKFMQILITK